MSCPDENTYARLLAGELPSGQAGEVQKHLDQCASCLDLVAALARLFGPDSPPDDSLPRRDEHAHRTYWWWPPGTVVNGKWKVDALLGVGGTGAVYAATHCNRRRAALKVLHPQLASHAGTQARFLREAYVANSVRHSGAVRVYDDAVAEDGAMYLVMELLEGESLEDRWVRGGRRLSLDEVLSVADQLLDVLEAAHAAGAVHRDLKPQNLFLVEGDRLKVLDFGIARLREPDRQVPPTLTGSLLGTLPFMAPEQARAQWRRVDARTDLWAVGAIMFTLLTGRHVHEAGTEAEALAAAMTRPAPPLTSLRPDLPDAVAQLVDRALSFDPEGRFPCAASMRGAVLAVGHGAEGMAPNAAPSSTSFGAEPSRPALAGGWWRGAMVGLLGGAFAGAVATAVVVSGHLADTVKVDTNAAGPATLAPFIADATLSGGSRGSELAGATGAPPAKTMVNTTADPIPHVTAEPPIRQDRYSGSAPAATRPRSPPLAGPATMRSPSFDLTPDGGSVPPPRVEPRPSAAPDPWSRRK
ncbi:MAG: protein kinase [Polyangiaceae bacterium]|nr:protein kinase [Polyangiaceae bacterium]